MGGQKEGRNVLKIVLKYDCKESSENEWNNEELLQRIGEEHLMKMIKRGKTV